METNSDLKALMNVSIDGGGHWKESGRNIELVRKSQKIKAVSKAEITEVYGDVVDAVCSIHPKPVLNRLKDLTIESCKDVEVVFEIESSSRSSSNQDLTTALHNHQPLLLPYLKDLYLRDMERMSHVWKCNWNKLVIPRNPLQSSFHNLTTITMSHCHNIQYLFSPLMGKLLPNLNQVVIYVCDGIEEVVSNRYDENDEMSTPLSTHTNTTSFPLLEKLALWSLPNLKSIDGGNRRGGSSTITTTSIHDSFKCVEVSVVSWFLCQYSKKIDIDDCHALSRVFPSCIVGQLRELEELIVLKCKSMVELFELEGANNDGVDGTNNVGDGTCITMTIPRSANMTLVELPNLTILRIEDCEVLEYIFTSSTLESLKQLKELTVKECKAMQVIVKEDVERTKISKTIIFPRLKSLTLANLPNLKGFFLGMNEFQWHILEKVEMYGCPKMVTFTSGHSMAPKLNHIHTGLGKHRLECGLNFHFTNATEETQLPMCSNPDMIKLLQFPWSFSNLVEVNARSRNILLTSRIIFSCNDLLNLKNLEKLHITSVDGESKIEELFEVVNDDANETNSVVEVPNLKELFLGGLYKLQHIWKNSRSISLKFPNLTKVSIKSCHLLGHVFTCCMVGSLLQLQELEISNCMNMNVIVKHVEDSETRATAIVFPCLKSITLRRLPNLKGFFLGKADFVWPSLDTLEIKDCPQITVFTNGKSSVPELKLIDTTFGLCHATEDPNSFIKMKQEEGWQF
ncbi:hypothetical protein L2E82_08654 [Cichorium intybus]|uniref:Uncharacterized protein n=1 Tax=Cichorium intybus TaxID=13427 RepID=A0ACB9G8P5_CICIN|nr:hypothetical protein L2E82_08654 [Cichorium intybus]